MANLKYKMLAAAILLALMSTGCREKKETVIENPPIIEKALNDSTSEFYGEFEEYPEELKYLPIGVFDSGTGGLTVLEKILSLDRFDNITGSAECDSILDFAGEHFIYLADQANMPYGNYDAVGKADYLRELAVKDALFLMDDQYYENSVEDDKNGEKPRVKILVIACNTATAYGLKDIQSMLDQSGTGVKVIGVINAGVKATLDELDIKDGDHPLAIGVLATPGTISSGAYERTINDMLAERGIKKTKVYVVNQSGYGFAEAVDSEPDFVNPSLTAPRDSYRGPRIGHGDDSLDIEMFNAYKFDFSDNKILYTKNASGKYTEFQLNHACNYARFNLVSLIEKYRLSGNGAPIKAVILGCTHYPFLLETLNQVIDELRTLKINGKYPYKEIIADDFFFVDPAVYTAIECYNTLREDGNLALRITPMEVRAYISVPSTSLDPMHLTEDGKLTHEFKYGRETGTEDITTKQVPFSKTNIDENNLQRIEQLLPYSYSLIYPTMK
jgi:Glutamate racemase